METFEFCDNVDGAATLEELAAALRTKANHYEELARAGWTLNEPIEYGWTHLVRSPASVAAR